ncbi:MAG: hypothetical protein ACLUA4_00110 [Bifidobacterium sp.]
MASVSSCWFFRAIRCGGTQAGIDLAGPRWFGYDLDYIPYEQIRSVLA